MRNDQLTLDFIEKFIKNTNLNIPSNKVLKTFIGIDVLSGPFYYSPIKNNQTLIGHVDLQNNFDYYTKSTFIISDDNSFSHFLGYYSLQENNSQTFIYIQRKDSPRFISDNMSVDI